VPTHERHCPLAATWYVTPPRASGPIDVLLALAREVDPGHTAHPLQSWRAREKMTAVNYLVRAAWRVYNSGG
jgi:hypothetical protein